MPRDAETTPSPKSAGAVHPRVPLGASSQESSGRQSRPLGLSIVLATGFGVGYSPVAPGTFGAALGVGIYCALVALDVVQIALPIVCVLLFAVGVCFSTVAEKRFQQKDCPRIVIDEIASFPLTMLLISPSPTRIAIAFALNRAGDILKPFPAGRIQSLKGGWGIMLDDTIAALYANLLLRLLILALAL